MRYLDRLLLAIIAYEWAGGWHKNLVVFIAIVTGINALVVYVRKNDDKFFENMIDRGILLYKNYAKFRIERKKAKYQNKLSKYRVDRELANLEKLVPSKKNIKLEEED